jgi:hypothetical protein
MLSVGDGVRWGQTAVHGGNVQARNQSSICESTYRRERIKATDMLD